MISTNEQQYVQDWLQAELNGERFPVDFDIAWTMAGYSRKDHAKRRLTNQSSYLVINEDYQVDKGSVLLPRSGESTIFGRSSDRVVMTCDAFKHFCLMAQTAKGREIRQYFIEVEKSVHQAPKTTPMDELLSMIPPEFLSKLNTTTIDESRKLNFFYFNHVKGGQLCCSVGKGETFHSVGLGYQEAHTNQERVELMGKIQVVAMLMQVLTDWLIPDSRLYDYDSEANRFVKR